MKKNPIEPVIPHYTQRSENLDDIPYANTESANMSSSFIPSNDELHRQTLSISRQTEKRLGYIKSIFISIAIIVLVSCSFVVWRSVRNYTVQNNLYQTIDELKDSGQYDKASLEVSRAKSKESSLIDWLRQIFAEHVEKNDIKRVEKEDLMQNGIIIGRNSRQFIGMNYKLVKQELEDRGFKNIKPVAMPGTDRKEQDSIIEIRINEDSSFKAKDKFFPDDLIEILYRVKE